MKKILFAVGFAALGMCSFAKGAKEPSWISNAYAGYDEDKYIIATSSGASYDDADKKALAGVGNIIRQDINSEEVVHQSSDSQGQNLSTYLSNIRTSTDIKSISGLSIKDRYKNKKGECFSRAILDKNAAAKFYSLELSKNSMEVESLIEESKKKKASFEASKNLLKAYKIALVNDEYVALLSFLKPSSHHVLSYESSAAIGMLVQNSLSDICVVINVAGDSDGRLSGAAAEAMGMFGISSSVAALSSSESPYVFTADFFCEDIDKDEGTNIFFCRAIISCSLTETATGKDVISFSRNSRQGKLSRKEARNAAVRAAENALKEDFAAKFKALLN
ncbi:MAG: hypothetical protein UHP28_06035 [Treponema sp.]|nr:hypothetical protein [Treponema sp.]